MLTTESAVDTKVHVDREETRSQVVYGGARAGSFIKEVVAGKLVNGKRYKFDEKLVMEIHDRLYYQNNHQGELRQTNSTTVSGKGVASASDLEWKFHLYGRWLEEEMDRLKEVPDDIVKGLEVAAAAHYGLVMPRLHPFDGGNGRTARALMNAILMSQSYELTAFGLAIPPIPILRSTKDGDYIRTLRMVDETSDLRPFMVFIAKKWVDSVDDRLVKIKNMLTGSRTKGDLNLISKLNWRKNSLNKFVEGDELHIENGHKNGNGTPGKGLGYKKYPIPDYFALRYIKP